MGNRAAARIPRRQLPTEVRGRKAWARGQQHCHSSGCSQLCPWGPYLCRLGPWVWGRRGRGTRGCGHTIPTGTTRKLRAALTATPP